MMAPVSYGFTLSRQEPDFEEALIALTLASCLLADKQRKLAGQMLGHAMNLMEPFDLVECLRSTYRRHNESLMAMVDEWQWVSPTKEAA